MKITAQQLEEFASKAPAKALLPELVRRLIRATADRIEDVNFPSGESTFRPGADGLLRAAGKLPYVPEGVSLWEVSTEKEPHQKGRRDIDKRSLPLAQETYLDKPRAEISYVALSLRRWHGDKRFDRDGFEMEQRARGIWKDVKVLDSEHLEEWLDNSPTVSAWLARRMHIVSEDMKSIEDFWEDYRTGITPPMSEQLLLLSRQEKADELIQAAVRGDFSRVKADSPNEAAAFVAAAILSLPDEDPRRNALLAKGVVITRPEADAFLTDTSQKLFVIALGRATDIASRLSARGHTVVAAYGNSHTSRGTNSPLIDLRRPKRHEFAEALRAMSMDEVTARVAAGACHCSITVLYRIRDLAHSRRPDWATPHQLGKLLGPMLCGAWLHLSETDAEVVATVAGVSRDQVEQNVLEVLQLDDAPVRREGDLTALSAPADIWQLGIEQGVISRPVLDRFRTAAIQVLGERDPSLDLPPERRVYAGIEGKKLTHSGALRRGIAEVLRLIAINEEHLANVGGGFSAQHFVDGILRDLPGLAMDYQTLASLDSLLPDLAEAAPDPFLSALEKLSSGDGNTLSPIFEGSDDPLFGRTYYLGTLRGLEVLAWDPAHLVRATQVLARLAELDPGGRLSNRPINSLSQIFLPWKPHTNASQDARHDALTRVCEKFPSIAWTLLTKLLPAPHVISFGTTEPEWREMGSSQRPVPTHASAACDWAFVVCTAIPLAACNHAHWIDLIQAAATLRDEPQLDMLLDQVEAKRDAFVVEQQDKPLWEAMSSLAAKHRAFESAAWAMPMSMIEKIEKSAAQFRPSDAISLYRHLFNHSMVERLDPGETFEQRRARAERERDAAVEEVSRHGIESVIHLAREAKTPGLIAASIVRTGSSETVREFVLESFDIDDQIAWLSGLVAAQACASFGFDWGIETINQIEAKGATTSQVASVLRLWDDSRELVELVASKALGVQSEYWSTRDAFVRSSDEDLVADTVALLIEHNRSTDLVQFLGARLEETDTTTLMRVVTDAFDDVVRDPTKVQRVDTYWLREIFASLRNRIDVDRDALMSLEYRWFPALHSYGDPQVFALHDYMGERPEFFIQVLSDLYRADIEVNDDEDEEHQEAEIEDKEAFDSEDAEDADGQARGRADIAYKLLESWRVLPWTKAGDLDYARMRDWVREAWRLAKEVGRLGVAEREVGKLLAYSLNDPEDGLWPQREVRVLIEELANTEMEGAIVTELFNKRGVHGRPIDGGGDSERELARKANELADKLLERWPRTARVLRDSAKDWLYHAQREDRRAAEKRISL